MIVANKQSAIAELRSALHRLDHNQPVIWEGVREAVDFLNPPVRRASMFDHRTCTHTFAELEVPRMFYDSVRAQLIDAGYEHAFDIDDPENGPIDMHGIALVPAKKPRPFWLRWLIAAAERRRRIAEAERHASI